MKLYAEITIAAGIVGIIAVVVLYFLDNSQPMILARGILIGSVVSAWGWRDLRRQRAKEKEEKLKEVQNGN